MISFMSGTKLLLNRLKIHKGIRSCLRLIAGR